MVFSEVGECDVQESVCGGVPAVRDRLCAAVSAASVLLLCRAGLWPGWSASAGDQGWVRHGGGRGCGAGQGGAAVPGRPVAATPGVDGGAVAAVLVQRKDRGWDIAANHCALLPPAPGYLFAVAARGGAAVPAARRSHYAAVRADSCRARGSSSCGPRTAGSGGCSSCHDGGAGEACAAASTVYGRGGDSVARHVACRPECGGAGGRDPGQPRETGRSSASQAGEGASVDTADIWGVPGLPRWHAGSDGGAVPCRRAYRAAPG
jgi:hypothetical protein